MSNRIFEDPLVIKAKKFAGERHDNQVYDGELMHMYHLECVALRSLHWGLYSPVITAACYLHDVLEDTETTYEELVKEFDPVLASVVFNVTDEEGANRLERWYKTAPKIRSSNTSLVVKLCDRFENMTHSLKTRSHHLGMYVKEYPVFKAALYDPWFFVDQWKEMDDLYLTMKESS